MSGLLNAPDGVEGWYSWAGTMRIHWVAAGQRYIACCGRALPSRRDMVFWQEIPQTSECACCAGCKRALATIKRTEAIG